MLAARPMPLVHYYVHGRGRGHATRSRAVITRLREAGLEVVAFAGEDAEPLLRDFVTTHPVRSLLPTAGRQAPRLLAARVHAAISALRRDRAALVISDGDLPGTLAARVTGRPSIAVGHGLVFLCCARPPGAPARPWRREALERIERERKGNFAVVIHETPEARGEADPIVWGGGPTATHPEPVAPFFDCFLIGEAEEALPDLLLFDAENKRKGIPRRDRLALLAARGGVYMPSLYSTVYDARSQREVVDRALDPRGREGAHRCPADGH